MSLARELSYGSVRIPYRLARRKDRSTIGVEVHPDGSVLVLVPPGATPASIQQVLAKRARWVHAKRQEFAAMGTGPHSLHVVSGMSVRYLGRQYRVRVRRAMRHVGPPTFVLSRSSLEIATQTQTPGKVLDAALEQWSRDLAKEVLTERVDACFGSFKRKGYPQPRLALRTMQTRWASLSSKGTLSANPRLVHEPLACIDYVLIHELCHLEHPNHGPNFIRVLSRKLPQWRMLKDRLERR